MSDRITFRSLSIEGFRGFRDRVDIDLDASVVLVSGANGTGKTSFFDALQWLLLGDIGRLRRHKTRSAEEYLVNQYRLGEPAVVTARVLLNGETVQLRRSGSSKSSLLEYLPDGGTVLRGDDAESALRAGIVPDHNMELSEVLLNAGLLQQDTMRAVLEAKPAERHEHLRRMLGLESVERFEDEAAARRKELLRLVGEAETSLASTRDELSSVDDLIATARLRASSRVSVQEAIGRLHEAIHQAPGLVLRTISIDAASSSLLAEELRQMIADFTATIAERDRAVQARDALRVTGFTDSESDLVELRARIATLTREEADAVSRASSARQQLREARERANQLAELASLAIPLLADVCPVCRQSIDLDHVVAELRSRAGDTSDLIELQEHLQAVEQSAATIWNQLEAMRREEAELSARIAAARTASDRIAATDERLRRLGQQFRMVSLELPTAELSHELVTGVTGSLELAREMARDLSVLLRADDDSAQGARLEGRRQTLVEVAQEKEKRLSSLQARLQDAIHLDDAAKKAGIRVSRARFDRILPFLRDTYIRLDPHPSFKSLDFTHVLFRSRGESTPVVRDDATGVEANPMLVFSAAQANIVALSYVFALNAAQQTYGLPFLLLDDPLQSMDDVNVLAFADLARHVRGRQQLVVATHSKRFASLLERKLAPREEEQRSVAIEFNAWSRSGPVVSQREISNQINDSTLRLLA